MKRVKGPICPTKQARLCFLIKALATQQTTRTITPGRTNTHSHHKTSKTTSSTTPANRISASAARFQNAAEASHQRSFAITLVGLRSWD